MVRRMEQTHSGTELGGGTGHIRGARKPFDVDGQVSLDKKT